MARTARPDDGPSGLGALARLAALAAPAAQFGRTPRQKVPQRGSHKAELMRSRKSARRAEDANDALELAKCKPFV